MPGPPASPPPPMLLLLLLLTVGCARAAPLPQTGAGEVPVVEVPSLFVILSVCSLLILIVLIANCVSCCKDPEIDFKEFEDNFDDEIDFTPPAEDTPSIQSPAEVFTLSVPNISLPAPSQFQASVDSEKSTKQEKNRSSCSPEDDCSIRIQHVRELWENEDGGSCSRQFLSRVERPLKLSYALKILQ